MNKASFLTLVRQASRISDQDVEELEKLVVNFPYCQTAHLLIAKAAYDKGSMLSNQKLKKAAIYAANRQLLKKLIYTSDASVALHPVENTQTVAVQTEKVTAETEKPAVAHQSETESLQIPVSETVAEPVLPAEENSKIEEQETSEAVADLKPVSEIPAIPVNEAEIIPELTIPEVLYEDAAIAEEILESEKLSESTTGVPEQIQDESIPIAQLTEETQKAEPEKATFISEEIVTELPANPEIQETIYTENETLEQVNVAKQKEISETIAEIDTDKPLTVENDHFDETSTITDSEETEKTVSETEEKVQELVAAAAHTLEDVPDMHELFLENAPELIQAEPEQDQTEQSPALNDELLHETLASFDQYLFRPEKESATGIQENDEEDFKVINPENEIRYIYDNDPLGYWMNSSRMGESLQLKSELTSTQPYDFHPELIWEFSKSHELQKEIKPAPSKLNKQLEIIDEFLKMTPRMKSVANSKMKAEPQEDLSSKSSKINKNLASENFANILIKQGKIKKAIKIYEHLILKIPEKKPYFVAQIEKLQSME